MTLAKRGCELALVSMAFCGNRCAFATCLNYCKR